MRKKFVLFILVPALIVGIIVYLFIDRWIESGLETAGEKIAKAKVEIDGLRTSVFPLAIEFRHMQVASSRDPWKNVFETGKVRASLDMGQLLRGKYIVETMEVNDFILGTKRTTDGSLPKQPAPEPSAPGATERMTAEISRKVSNTPVFDLSQLKKGLKIDSLLDVHSFRSIQHIDSLKVQIGSASKQWDATLADVEKSKEKISGIEAGVKSINVNELKTVESITSAITKVNSAYNDVKQLNDLFTTRRVSITNDVAMLTGSIGEIDDLATADYERVKGMAKLPDMSLQGMATLLLGKSFLSEVNYYLSWIDVAREKIPKYTSSSKIETPPRLKGQNISFPTERSYPKFWIKKILITGGTDARQDPEFYYGKGEVRNITSDQRTAGEPMTIDLKAVRGGRTSLSLNALFDRREPVPHDHYTASLAGVPMGSVEIGSKDFLPSRMTKALATIKAEVDVPGANFDAHALVDFSNAQIAFDRDPKGDVERIVHDVLQPISAFNVDVRAWDVNGKFDVALATDLDEQLAARTKAVVGAELARIENDLRRKVDAKIAEKRKEVETLFNKQKDAVMTRIKGYQDLVDEKLGIVDAKKKELENRLNQEKSKQIDAGKQKVNDFLKGVLKKK